MDVEKTAADYIADKCCLRPEAVVGFIRDERLDPLCVAAAIGRRFVDSGEFVAAVVGLPGNVIRQSVIAVIRGE